MRSPRRPSPARAARAARAALLGLAAGAAAACAGRARPALLPTGVEAVSLLGDTLRAPALSAELRARREAQLAAADSAWRAAPSADALIWVGRRTAYLGRYRDAIDVFSDGIRRWPGDARMYRHRGHRRITVRDFDGAISDLTRAAALMEGKPDEVEPDGLPNARGIPTSTLQSNVRYHLGLAHYLKGDFARALPWYQADVRRALETRNADMLVASTHWLYMTLRRLGRAEEAHAALAPISRDMDVIENGAYHRLLLLYEGELPVDSLLAPARGDDPALEDATVGYGVGNWYLYNGDRAAAERVFRRVLSGGQWASFGYVASEAELSRMEPVAAPRQEADGDWPFYGRDPGGARSSPLAQITRENVARLAVAWRFSTGEAGPGYETRRRTSFEATPLVVDGTMYVSTPLGRVFALDAATGRERWRFNPGVVRTSNFGDFTNRGVTYWVDSAAAPAARCRTRVFVATIDARLVALDARDGATCPAFGDGGMVDLRRGLRNAPGEFAEYEVTSPPAVVRGMLVVGSAVADNGRVDMASGEVRGYDARTGALRWTWHPVPQDSSDAAFGGWRGSGRGSGASGHRTGAANAWSIIAADPARDMVFVPTSSPSPDYYGGERLGDNRYANSVVALRASTGQLVWAFQTVHHDLWDYDNAAPPALVTVRRNGRALPAVLQATKSGMLFVLHRETGEPIVPVEERPVPASTVQGERASPTQPFSTLPPLSPFTVRPADAFGADSADRAACRETMSKLRHEGPFTPPSLEGTLALPSNIGGAHWGGLAFDASRQLAVVPVNEVGAVAQLIPREQFGPEGNQGRSVQGWEYAPMRDTPYVMRRQILLSPKRVPCTPPPFGSLVAVDVAQGRIAWRVPLGTPGPIAPPGIDSATLRRLGSVNLGGPIVTAGGLVFIAATLDQRLRAFDVETGRELWSAPLPAGGKATPMTYMAGGRQFVAIAAGGDGGDVFGKGDELVVFALPARR
ncbi:MAG: PQQ-binding-like beta-propeller repeat protein [Gemmatimonadaceae bacterium]